MAKWSNIYLDDSLKLPKKVEKKLAKVVNKGEPNYEGDEEDYGKYRFALELQAKIKKWRKQMFNEEGGK